MLVQAADDEYEGDVLDPDDAVGLADHLSSAFGASLPLDLQDALAAFLDSQQDSDGGDATVLVSTVDDSAAAVAEPSVQTPRGVLPAVLATAAGIVGGALTAEQPLMDAGLDSLGASHLQLVALAIYPVACSKFAGSVKCTRSNRSMA